LIAIGRLHQVNRLLADHTDDVAVTAHEPDALSDEHLRVPAADRRRVDETLVVDVLHDQPDLVDVAIEHDRRRSARVDLCHGVAGDVAGDLISERRRFFAPNAGGWRLEAGWSRRIEQTFQKRQRGRAQH
jgi:hypothetical protein